MPELPESVTLEWIGRTLLEMKGEIRSINERLTRLEERFDCLEQRFDRLEQRFDRLEQRFDRFEIETSDRFNSVEAGLFRADAAWRGVQEACGEILYQLRAKQHH